MPILVNQGCLLFTLRGSSSVSSRPANGLQWNVGAISNAEWTGVRLRDVLKHAGLQVDELPQGAKHVQFQGGEGYGASIPIHKACDPRGDVLMVVFPAFMLTFSIDKHIGI